MRNSWKQIHHVSNSLALVSFCLLLGHTSWAIQCRQIFSASQFQKEQVHGDIQTLSLPQGLVLKVRQVRLDESGLLPSVFKRLTDEIQSSLAEYLQAEKIVLITFEHSEIGGFVTSRQDQLFQQLFGKRQAARPILALNVKRMDNQLVAHEFVHLRDEVEGVLDQVYQDLHNALNGLPKSELFKELLARYIAEYRAENETVFYDQNLQFVKEQYLYQSMVLSASRVPDQIFGDIRSEFRQLPKPLQKELKLKINRVVRLWTKYPPDQAFLPVQRL